MDRRLVTALSLIASAALYVALRMQFIGHILTWDEAIALCSLRSHAGGYIDFSTSWFWRHPPGHMILLSVLSPLKAGFAERAEALNILAGLGTLFVMYALNKRVFGQMTALWSTFALALMPGSIFFDVWIKQDVFVALFGLLAIYFMVCDKPLISGLLIGLALLFKETAAFYFVVCLLLWAFGGQRRRTVRAFIPLVVLPAIFAAAWYLIILPTVRGAHDIGGYISVAWERAFDHFFWASSGTAVKWSSPWYFYLKHLNVEFGTVLRVLAPTGLLLSLLMPFRRVQGDQSDTPQSEASRAAAFWPVFLLLPAHTMLAMLSSKVAWIVISFFPAWATLAGISLSFLTGRTGTIQTNTTASADDLPAHTGRRIVIAVSCAIALISAAIGLNYETILRSVAPGQLVCAQHSMSISAMVDANVKDGDRMLVTSFCYWDGLPPGHPCAVFTENIKVKPDIVAQCWHKAPPEYYTDQAKTLNLHWALISPEPGKAYNAVKDHFRDNFGLTPVACNSMCLLYDVSSIDTHNIAPGISPAPR